MAKSGTLKDPKTGEIVYPITLASNVYDANGNGIPSVFATKEEITHVLLWQNGNPTGSMDYTEITGLPISQYDEFDLYYKASSGANIGMQKMTIRKGTNSDQYFIVSTVSVSNGSMSYRSRVCAIKLTGSLIFETAYNGTSVKNDYIIPVLFYGRKV